MENSTLSSSAGEPKSLGAVLLGRIRAAFSGVSIHPRARRLKLCETLSLGEKRLVALIECENQRFLVAATAENISLLHTLSVSQEKDSKSDL